MKKGHKRPRQWDVRPVPGLPSEGAIRTALASIAQGLKGKITHKQRIEYLCHWERLDQQLRTVAKQKLTAQLALIESCSQSEQVGEKSAKEKNV